MVDREDPVIGNNLCINYHKYQDIPRNKILHASEHSNGIHHNDKVIFQYYH